MNEWVWVSLSEWPTQKVPEFTLRGDVGIFFSVTLNDER